MTLGRFYGRFSDRERGAECINANGGDAAPGSISHSLAQPIITNKVTGATIPVDAGHLTLSGFNPVSTRANSPALPLSVLDDLGECDHDAAGGVLESSADEGSRLRGGFANLLRGTSLSVALIAENVGYPSEAAFSRAFKHRYGTPPARWRRDVRAS